MWGWGDEAAGPTTTFAPAEEMELTWPWMPYCVIMVFSLAMQVVSGVAMILWCATSTRRRCRRAKVRSVASKVAVVVPCYLPNEAPILMDTVDHLLTQLEHVQDLDVYIVYNTPTPMDFEEDLRQRAAGPLPEGRRLFVERVAHSTSKAENLNFVIPKVTAKYIGVYDADHHPDSDSLALSVEHLEDMRVDCVQGSTYIRQGCFLLRMFIHAEFFVCYFVQLPMMQMVAGTGFFGGANGVWRASSLKQLTFDDTMLTEDIECFVRAMVEHGLSFAFLPESRSGELAPGGLTAFWKQRLRWAMGWDEVTVTHTNSFWRASLPLRKRLGLYYIFVFRWVMQFCTVVIVVFNAYPCFEAFIIQDTEHNQATPSAIKCMQLLSSALYLVLIIFSFLQAFLHEPRCCLLAGLFLFFSVTPLWVCFNSVLLCVSLVRVASGTTGSWVVTTRSSGYEMQTASVRQRQLKMSSSAALWVLGLGFSVLGALAGAWVGHILGRREEERKLWGWVPFGIGATRTVVVDGRYVAVGAAAGSLLGVLALFVIRAVFKVTASCTGRPDLCACDVQIDEDEEAACQHPLLMPVPRSPPNTRSDDDANIGAGSSSQFTTIAERVASGEIEQDLDFARPVDRPTSSDVSEIPSISEQDNNESVPLLPQVAVSRCGWDAAVYK